VLAPHQPQNDQQDHRADKGIDNRGNNAAADVDAEAGQEPAGDDGADDERRSP